MKQQINLYQERFYLKRVVLPAKEMYSLMGLFLVLLAITSIILEVAYHQTSRVKSDLSRQEKTVVASNEKLQLKLTNNKVSPELQVAVLDAERKLLAKKRVLNWVKQSQSEERALFSAILKGLAKNDFDGLWLTEVTVDQKSSYTVLRGNTLEPGFVPAFLAALKKEAEFSGTEFYKMKIEEELETGVLSFLLTNKPPAMQTGSLATLRRAGYLAE